MIEFAKEAEKEFDDARKWYEREAAKGDEFTDAVNEVLAKIDEAPKRFPEWSPGTRWALVPRFPYFVVFQIRKHARRVLAVSHGHREPGYWIGRR